MIFQRPETKLCEFCKEPCSLADKRKRSPESTLAVFSFESSFSSSLFGNALEQPASMNILETKRSEMADLYPRDSAYLTSVILHARTLERIDWLFPTT